MSRPASLRRAPSLGVGAKFVAAVSVVVLAVLAVAAIGYVGQARAHQQTALLYDDTVVTLQRSGELAAAVEAVREAQSVQATQVDATTRLESARLADDLTNEAERALASLLARQENPALFRELETLGSELAEVERAHRARLDTAIVGGSGAAAPVTFDAQFDRMQARLANVQLTEFGEAAEFKASADASDRLTRLQLGLAVLVSLALSLVVVLLLTRNLVPRVRRYSRFATELAAGRDGGLPLHPSGRDELADLGRALDLVVTERVDASRQEGRQAEFIETLQVMSSEEEVHELLQHQLERAVPGCVAIVMQRNNSANRLQVATTLPADDCMSTRLAGAEPRSCLALRFGRTHREGGPSAPLLACTLCSDRAGTSTCEPLQVAGEVIGAVLVTGLQPLGQAEDTHLRTCVSQAAPVLANLRNLALAEFRANNDSLTGLPNKRATDDTLKRLVAQASRSVMPLTAVMLDLDHFKQINDRFGHAKGDEVLAAVGAAITSCLRASDFAGRFGGEEFLILLSDTAVEGALPLSERLRASIAALTVVGVEQKISASLGVAGLLTDSGSATGLLEQADRALYAAKSSGRNRVVLASTLLDASGEDRPAPQTVSAAPLDAAGA